MFKYFYESYDAWYSIDSAAKAPLTGLNVLAHWLHDTYLFEDAWRIVSIGPFPWLWSHQICMFTATVLTTLMAVEGTRRRIPHTWAFMLLGQLVAISVTTSLFLAAMSVFPVTHVSPTRSMTCLLLFCCFGGLATILMAPQLVDTEYFLPNLVIMHGLLILPLLKKSPVENSTKQSQTESSALLGLVYLLTAGGNAVLYMSQWTAAIQSLSAETPGVALCSFRAVVSRWLWTFFNTAAQGSISSDVVCITLATMVWVWIDSPRTRWTVLLVVLTPIVSCSVTLPVYLAMKELQDICKIKPQ
ncbi:hypothetical protein BDF14DRAFT_1739797 [Spinellus fusiger]|nr:hypothetical protein BDF14DRAFT_1739797 [Spinellus fusiger]